MSRIYTENTSEMVIESAKTQQVLAFDAQSESQPVKGMNATSSDLRRREQLKLKLTRLWVGASKEMNANSAKTETLNEKRHRLRFWKNNKEEPPINRPVQMPSWMTVTDVSSSEESYAIRDHFKSKSISESPVSSVSETNTVIWRPYHMKSAEERADMPNDLTTSGASDEPNLSLNLITNHSVSPRGRVQQSLRKSSLSSIVASSLDAVDTFSPVSENSTPITLVPFIGSSSSDGKLNSSSKPIWKPCTGNPPSGGDIFFLDDSKRSDARLHFKPHTKSEQSSRECQSQKVSPCQIEKPPSTDDLLFDICSDGSPDNKTPDFKTTYDEPFSTKWDHIEDELWIAKLLKEYCPVRLRKNKRMNFDSEEFRLLQADMTFRTLIDQELRDRDKKLLFRPSLSSGKSFFRGIFHFEEDEDVLDVMDHFILCNNGLIPLFRGYRPAVRKHILRRWHNHDRDRIIVCEQLMEKWLEDENYLAKLREDRNRRQERRALMESDQETDDQIPPLSFFAKKLLIRLSGRRGRIGKPPKRGSKLLVFKKEPLFGIPYFEKKKRQVKTWIKELVLSI